MPLLCAAYVPVDKQVTYPLGNFRWWRVVCREEITVKKRVVTGALLSSEWPEGAFLKATLQLTT